MFMIIFIIFKAHSHFIFSFPSSYLYDAACATKQMWKNTQLISCITRAAPNVFIISEDDLKYACWC